MGLTIAELERRSIEIFRELVDAYVETGEPVGSRTLSRRLSSSLSPATVRNIMADLEDVGLLYSPHTSAGRLPTEMGMRYFVHGLLEVGELSVEDRQLIEERCLSADRNFKEVLTEATSTLSGLSQCAGLVLAPKMDSVLRHVEFVHLGIGRALVVIINEDGTVENRLIDVPADISSGVLQEATNFLSHHLAGRTLAETRSQILVELEGERAQLNELTSKVVEAGIAIWAGDAQEGSLIIRGQSHLLENLADMQDLDRIRELFHVLEGKETLYRLLDASVQANGVQIFLGSDNRLFNLAGCSLVIAPYKGSRQQILGSIGVIGPARMNYSRIIPMVEYTAKMIGRLLG